MLTYILSSPQPEKGFLHINFEIDNLSSDTLDLYLPAWRPGRYELQNYARNILSVTACDITGKTLEVAKVSRNIWRIQTKNQPQIIVKSVCFARQMDAGGSWIDDKMWYINFINFLFFIKNRQTEPCEVKLQIPDTYQIACGLSVNNKTVSANNYFELTDSPLIASASLQNISYQSHQTKFHIRITGNTEINEDLWKADFQKFTDIQGKLFSGFPFKEYHFLIHLLPHKAYHGVEHRNSTVITIGVNPEDENKNPVDFESIYKTDLLGIASHELFHVWNICRIRPKELLPYDFTKEVYFNTGYIAEGITTYYGDLMLVRSGVWTTEAFFTEISKTLNRHFNTSDQAVQSLHESSFDLWIDGYKEGIPNKKVSIYHKGCLVTLLLDLAIRKLTHNAQSLDNVMQMMWQNFGKLTNGYTHEDFINICEKITGVSMHVFFEECVEGNSPLLEKLNEMLEFAGCQLETEDFMGFEDGKSIKISQKAFLTENEQATFSKWLR